MKEMKLMREIRHTNVNNFIGAMVDQDNIKLVTEFCSKGALFDLLNNPDVKLDLMFVASLISDLGAKYLGFFSSCSPKIREKYISFAQFVYFLREVCLLFNF